ncbi:hypothetical protein BZG36_04345 [Bifiguratus adelaidae]|uniref:mitochondrial processing peptidase n=1 Tax=Bifiguratus adelaidae TaxID=1938954 RepID=A0A261XX49_9FUNG|nr:hypothetical protein BZG36_04345 [Bifiguratus adelaidae]
MPFITAQDGTKLFYRDWGHKDGQPVILQHGWPFNSVQWEQVAADLLQDQHVRLIMPDRRGFGRSDDPGHGFNLDTFVEDLHTLLTSLHLSKSAILVGNSMGGAEAVKYANCYGTQDIAGIVLVASSVPCPTKNATNEYGSDPEIYNQICDAFMLNRHQFTMEGLPNVFGAHITPKDPSSYAEPALAPRLDAHPYTIQWAAHMVASASFWAILETMKSIRDIDVRKEVEELGKSDVSVLLLHGDKDVSQDINNTAKRVLTMVPNAELKVYEDGPHGVINAGPAGKETAQLAQGTAAPADPPADPNALPPDASPTTDSPALATTPANNAPGSPTTTDAPLSTNGTGMNATASLIPISRGPISTMPAIRSPAASSTPTASNNVTSGIPSTPIPPVGGYIIGAGAAFAALLDLMGGYKIMAYTGFITGLLAFGIISLAIVLAAEEHATLSQSLTWANVAIVLVVGILGGFCFLHPRKLQWHLRAHDMLGAALGGCAFATWLVLFLTSKLTLALMLRQHMRHRVDDAAILEASKLPEQNPWRIDLPSLSPRKPKEISELPFDPALLSEKLAPLSANGEPGKDALAAATTGSSSASDVVSNRAKSVMEEARKYYKGKRPLSISEETNPTAQTATVGVWIDAGSRAENAKNNGSAHFLEHMAFKGTKKRSQRDLELEVENLGAHLNAYTSREQTVYYAKAFKNDVPRAVEILSDILQNSNLDKQAIERERDVILRESEEVNKLMDEVVFDHLHATAYQGESLGRTILGPRENIESLTREDLENYIKTNYKADRMVLVGAGAVDHDALVKLAEQQFGNLTTSANPLKLGTPSTAKPSFTGSEIRLRDDTVPQAHIAIAVEGCGWTSPDYYSMLVLQSIVGSWDRTLGASSHLSSRLSTIVSKNQLANSFMSFNTSYTDTGLWGIYMVTENKDQIDDLVHFTQAEWARLSISVTEGEVERAKQQLKASLLLGLDGTTAVAEDIGRQMVTTGKRLSPQEVEAAVNAVTVKDVRRVAGEYLWDKEVAVVGGGPIECLTDYNRVRGNMSYNRY